MAYRKVLLRMSKAEVTKHLTKFDKPQRDALETVRKYIREIIPEADEVIKWNMPTFVLNGKGVIAFDGFKRHNSIFPYDQTIRSQLKDDLLEFEQTKGSIHFGKNQVFPKSILKKILRIRLKDLASNKI